MVLQDYSLGAELLDLPLEMDKILVSSGFSTLELHLEATSHVSGALVSRLLGMHHIRTATQRFKLLLEHPSEVRSSFVLFIHLLTCMHSILDKHN